MLHISLYLYVYMLHVSTSAFNILIIIILNSLIIANSVLHPNLLLLKIALCLDIVLFLPLTHFVSFAALLEATKAVQDNGHQGSKAFSVEYFC